MINAKTEFLHHTESRPKVKCAVLRDFDDNYRNDGGKEIFLKKGYTDAELAEFLAAIDFEYYNGYGSQELYGFIWYEGGTWSERWEYDGSEGWGYNVCPKLPKGCK